MATIKLPLGLLANGTVNTPSELSIGNSSATTLLNSRYSYGAALVQNVGASDVYIRIGGTATSAVYHVKLTPNSQADVSDASYVDVTAICKGSDTSKVVVYSVQVNDSVSQGATAYGS